jgi:hypothetical protein
VLLAYTLLCISLCELKAFISWNGRPLRSDFNHKHDNVIRAWARGVVDRAPVSH